MQFHMWSLFAIAYLLLTVSPGPNVFLVLSHSLKYGFASIYITIFANLFCQLLIVIAVTLGVGALLTVDSAAFSILKYAGAAYLVYLGVKTLYSLATSAYRPIDVEGRRQMQAPARRRRFREAFLVSASNPKAVIFLAAFLPQFLSHDRPFVLQFAIMYLTIAAIVLSVHSAYAFAAVSVKRQLSGRILRNGASALSGLLFIAFGLVLSFR